ncbi:MAG: hypothetical protein Q4D21_01565 [Phascolarctobacterium sp.]|nr:hypothetical protein [Phascolarctobacterium sp.]
MDPQEWNAYVQKIATCDYPIPAGMINNYNDWKHRSIVGRMLYLLKDVEGAMAVLATVRDVVPNMDDAPDYGLSEAEHKVLCLRDIANIVFSLTGMGDAAIVYLKQADKICRDYKYVFRSASRGAIWTRQLEIMRDCGLGDEADSKALACLKGEGACGNGIDSHYLVPGTNTYIYHAYKFLAESAALHEDYAKAARLLAEGYRFFPLSDAGKQDLARAAACETAKEQYYSYEHCTTIQYLPWEKTNAPTVDEVRKLQYRKYLERLAAKQEAEGVGADILKAEQKDKE